jgi:hypothetical protein
MISEERAPLGIKLLSIFFALGAAICLITIIALPFPGGALEPIWRLNPDAHVAFSKDRDVVDLVDAGGRRRLRLSGNWTADTRAMGASARARDSHCESHRRSGERVSAT